MIIEKSFNMENHHQDNVFPSSNRDDALSFSTLDFSDYYNSEKSENNATISDQYVFTMSENNQDQIEISKHPSMSEYTNHLWKYNEDKILADIKDYVTATYKSHYCGSDNNYRDIQTIDLMAAKELAANFCQANILKYGSRYGQKDGRNKIDLLKVIHYAMLLLHFDGHYSRKNNGLSEFR